MADGISFDASELNALAATLSGAGARAGRYVSAVVRKTAADIERDAKVFAPVDTGNLRNSIGVDLHGDGRSPAISAEIGPTANYGAFVEFGTSRMAPQAYMGPAFDRHSGQFSDAMQAVADLVLGDRS